LPHKKSIEPGKCIFYNEGNDYLNILKKLNVGALYLPNVNSPFNMKDNENNLQREVASTGVYLNENGTAGTIQQVNIVV